MRVRLIMKLADVLNGVDLSRYREGDVLDLNNREASMLIADGWAEPVSDTRQAHHATAADTGRQGRRRADRSSE